MTYFRHLSDCSSYKSYAKASQRDTNKFLTLQFLIFLYIRIRFFFNNCLFTFWHSAETMHLMVNACVFSCMLIVSLKEFLQLQAWIFLTRLWREREMKRKRTRMCFDINIKKCNTTTSFSLVCMRMVVTWAEYEHSENNRFLLSLMSNLI